MISGYDAYPIDGVHGTRTQAAITKFLSDRKLAADTSSGANFFDVLVEAARNPEGVGFSWCNDTNYAARPRSASSRWEQSSHGAGTVLRPANV